MQALFLKVIKKCCCLKKKNLSTKHLCFTVDENRESKNSFAIMKDLVQEEGLWVVFVSLKYPSAYFESQSFIASSLASPSPTGQISERSHIQSFENKSFAQATLYDLTKAFDALAAKVLQPSCSTLAWVLRLSLFKQFSLL